MCCWVGSPAPSCGLQHWRLPSRMEYLSRQGVLLRQMAGGTEQKRGNAPASLRYDRLTSVARFAGPLCLAGDPLLGCVPARLSSVASMAPGDVCHGPGCSLAGLGPVALEYPSCHAPGWLAGLPGCV